MATYNIVKTAEFTRLEEAMRDSVYGPNDGDYAMDAADRNLQYLYECKDLVRAHDFRMQIGMVAEWARREKKGRHVNCPGCFFCFTIVPTLNRLEMEFARSDGSDE